MPTLQYTRGLIILNDTVYHLRSGSAVYKYLGTGKGWQHLGSNPDVTNQLALTTYALYAWDRKFTISVYNSADNSWKVVDRSPEHTVIDSSAKFVYKLHTDQGRIYQYSSKDWNLIDDGEKAKAIAVDEDDTLYRLHADDRISKYLGSEGWQEIDSTPNVQRILAGGGKLYKLHKDNSVYVHVEDYDWDSIDKNPEIVQVAAGAAGVFKRHRDGGVWRYDESAKKWDLISRVDANHYHIAVGNTVYIRHSSEAVFRYDGDAGNWTTLT